jgi:hypothetical protein
MLHSFAWCRKTQGKTADFSRFTARPRQRARAVKKHAAFMPLFPSA